MRLDKSEIDRLYMMSCRGGLGCFCLRASRGVVGTWTDGSGLKSTETEGPGKSSLCINDSWAVFFSCYSLFFFLSFLLLHRHHFDSAYIPLHAWGFAAGFYTTSHWFCLFFFFSSSSSFSYSLPLLFLMSPVPIGEGGFFALLIYIPSGWFSG